MVLNEEEDLTLVLLLTKEETKEFLECIRIKYSEKFEGNSNYYNLIIQRGRSWGRLLAQKFGASSRQVKVINAWEAAADDGGPLREFLNPFCGEFLNIPGIKF